MEPVVELIRQHVRAGKLYTRTANVLRRFLGDTAVIHHVNLSMQVLLVVEWAGHSVCYVSMKGE